MILVCLLVGNWTIFSLDLRCLLRFYDSRKICQYFCNFGPSQLCLMTESRLAYIIWHFYSSTSWCLVPAQIRTMLKCQITFCTLEAFLIGFFTTITGICWRIVFITFSLIFYYRKNNKVNKWIHPCDCTTNETNEICRKRAQTSLLTKFIAVIPSIIMNLSAKLYKSTKFVNFPTNSTLLHFKSTNFIDSSIDVAVCNLKAIIYQIFTWRW